MTKPNYSLVSKFEKEEKEKQAFQSNCVHTFWSTRCGICGKYLASDHHINFHTQRHFKKNNKVAILLLDGSLNFSDLTLYRIQELKYLKEDYDELTIITDSPSSHEILSSLKYPNRVILSTLSEEIKHMRKYRKEDVEEITLVLYPDTKQSEELQSECKKLKISSIIRETKREQTI